MSRATDLLRAVAEDLDDMRTPLSHEFLVEHEVTADEVFALSGNLATAARMMATKLDDMMSGSGLAAQTAAMDVVTTMLEAEQT